MSSINIETLLEPVAGDNPCGEDLSDLTEYYVLEDLATGKEEDGFGGEAQEPQWPQVIDLATELLAQGKELRVVVLLAHALVAREGADGLRDGLQLLRRMLEQYWDGLYPELDPDDDAPIPGVSDDVVRYEVTALIDSISGKPLNDAEKDRLTTILTL